MANYLSTYSVNLFTHVKYMLNSHNASSTVSKAWETAIIRQVRWGACPPQTHIPVED